MLRADDAALTEDLAASVGAVFAEELRRYEIPGGVLVLVRDAEIVLARGYGYADLQTRTPVDPQTTLFYIASVTKTFTATAALQLVEQGKLRLHQDVNQVLKQVQVPGTYPEVVTLHHLLTHTAGLDDRNIGYVAREAAGAVPLGEYLRTQLPPRVMPPGRMSSYSNHGYGLAGLLVESASGQRFESYLERHILRPLGMNRSTAHTPPPAHLEKHLATHYLYDARSDAYLPHPLGYRNMPPAGTVNATGEDMARFLIMHLQEGVYRGTRILQPETARLLRQRQFSHHADLPGFTYGFYERRTGGHTYLEHGGGFLGAAALVALFPDRKVGFFAATNQSTSFPHQAALDRLARILYPDSVTESPFAITGASSEEYAGSYQHTRYSRTSVEKIAILDSQMQVTAERNGILLLQSRRGNPTRWLEVGNSVFRKENGSELLAFGRDSDGRVTHMYLSLPGSGLPAALERLSWMDSLPVQLAILFSTAAVFLSVLVLWPLSLLFTAIIRRFRRSSPPPDRRSTAGFLLPAVVSLLAVLFVIGVDVLLGNSLYRNRLIYGMSREMIVLLWIPIIMAALVVPLTFRCIGLWTRKTWSFAGRIYYSAITLAALVFLAFLVNWNLLGFRY